MLVVTRKANEAIELTIDGQIVATIRIVEIRKNAVRVGVDAPSSTRVTRTDGEAKQCG